MDKNKHCSSGAQLAVQIKELAEEIGYSDCGITHAGDFEEYARAIELRKRRFPDASDLYDKLASRARPRSFNPWANSIVVCVRRYGKYKVLDGLPGNIGRSYLFDRRNRSCPDHNNPKQMKDGLKRMGFRVRQGGVPDRWAGARAGVTRFGKNCFAYSKHGSWINIEAWLIDAELPVDEPSLEPVCPDDCRACIDACPTGALIEPFVMRLDHCIAHLTYAAPLPIERSLLRRMGKWIYGCDKCQKVCPLNKGAWEELEDPAWLRQLLPFLKPEALATMTPDTYKEKIHPAFWYIPLDHVERWHENAARALAYERKGKLNESDREDTY